MIYSKILIVLLLSEKGELIKFGYVVQEVYVK